MSHFLQATLLYAAPPLVLFLASHPGVQPKYLQSLRHVMCGAAPLGGQDAERFLKKAPPNTDIVQGSMRPLFYLTNIFIYFLLALVLTWPGGEAHKQGGK
jgi:acyl-CoA synthetase (AMP-forming)/AMP-acid ligase II